MGSIYKRGNIFWIKYSRGGRRFRESSESKKLSIAKRLLRLREGQIAEGKFTDLEPERIRYEHLEKDLLNDYKINERKSLKMVQYNLNHLRGYFGGMKAKNITADRVRAYVVWRKRQQTHYGRPPTNATINRELSALKRMFTLGSQGGRVRAVPYISKLKENNVRTGFFSHYEYLSLRDALPDYLRPVVAFAYYTGMRKSEILRLVWSQVDLQEGTVRLEAGTTKNDDARTVALPSDLWDELKNQRALRDKEFLGCKFVFFNHKTGKQIKDYRDAWDKATGEVGLDGRLFHDFRRTGVRNLLRAGVPERVAMAISGHKTRTVFDRYNIVDERDIREASEKVQGYLRDQESAIEEKVVELSRKVENRKKG
jgi:integrase